MDESIRIKQDEKIKKEIIKREKTHNKIMQNYGIHVHDFVNKILGYEGTTSNERRKLNKEFFKNYILLTTGDIKVNIFKRDSGYGFEIKINGITYYISYPDCTEREVLNLKKALEN